MARDYYSARRGLVYAVLDQDAVLVRDGFKTRDAADDFVVLLQATERPDVDAEYRDELASLRRLIDAQGGYVAPDDVAGQARGRAIDDVLAAIDAISAAPSAPASRALGSVAAKAA